MFRAILILLMLTIDLYPARAQDLSGSRHVLKGRIIRSLAVEPGNADHIIVGQKSGKPGSALVFQSIDGGKTWRTLNGNQPLAPAATDVQAVAALSRNVIFAGTWKHGLYVSRHGGRHLFSRIADFPSPDIRDLQVVGAVVYAATAGHGVFKSTDEGKTWQALGPSTEFFWSITSAPEQLLASSLEQAVYARRDGAWQKIFDRDKAYAAATSPARKLLTVAGETGLYVSRNGDWRKFLAGEKLADVVIFDQNHLIAASWTNGVAIVTFGGIVKKRLFKGQAVLHLQPAGDHLLVATWGGGLHIVPLASVLQ